MYQIARFGVIRLPDNVAIPNDPENPDWQKYQFWLASGNTPQGESLSEAQSAQLSILETSYQSAIQQPVSFTTAGGVTKTFQADENSQDVLVKATQGYGLAGAVPSGFYWVASDNTQVPFTLADLKGLYNAILSQGWTAFQHLQTQKAAVRAATTVAQVQSVTW